MAAEISVDRLKALLKIENAAGSVSSETLLRLLEASTVLKENGSNNGDSKIALDVTSENTEKFGQTTLSNIKILADKIIQALEAEIKFERDLNSKSMLARTDAQQTMINCKNFRTAEAYYDKYGDVKRELWKLKLLEKYILPILILPNKINDIELKILVHVEKYMKSGKPAKQLLTALLAAFKKAPEFITPCDPKETAEFFKQLSTDCQELFTSEIAYYRQKIIDVGLRSVEGECYDQIAEMERYLETVKNILSAPQADLNKIQHYSNYLKGQYKLHYIPFILDMLLKVKVMMAAVNQKTSEEAGKPASEEIGKPLTTMMDQMRAKEASTIVDLTVQANNTEIETLSDADIAAKALI